MSKTYKGIDISEYQKIVNWNKVAKQIDFLILRAGYGNTISQKDKMFESHIKGAVQAGIKNIGIYYFSYARSIKEAEKEANVCLDIINPYKKNINMPIAFDWEDDSYRYCIKYKITPTRKLCDSMATAFCKVIEKAGYQSMLYTNPNYLSQFFTRSKYKHLWVAQYFSKCQIANVDIWQYTDKGRINGISGNVDMDYCYNSAIMAPVSTVKAQIANKNSVLRDAAHLEAKILCNLPIGTKVEWIADDDWGWSKIKYNGKIGYVQNTRISGKNGLSRYRIATVTVDGLKVRTTKSLEENNIYKILKKGNTFTVVCINPSGWIVANLDGKDYCVYNNPNYFKIGGRRS